MKTTIIAGIAGAAGLALSAATVPAHAEPGQLNGHYIESSTNRETGRTMTNHWFFDSCGSGCAGVQLCDSATRNQCQGAQAHLADGRWTMDAAKIAISCSDGTRVPDAAHFHYTWDAVTLTGTGTGVLDGPGCPNAVTPPGTTVDIVLRPA